MKSSTDHLPKDYHSVTPYLAIRDAVKAIEFYKRAFGATEKYSLLHPDGKVMHAEIKIGNSVIMISEEAPEWGAVSPEALGGCSTTFMIYVPDVDAAHAQAIEAGAKETMPVADQFWGDRMGGLIDPYGFKWCLATCIEDLSPEEMSSRYEEWKKENKAC
jgi:PhnB protein